MHSYSAKPTIHTTSVHTSSIHISSIYWQYRLPACLPKIPRPESTNVKRYQQLCRMASSNRYQSKRFRRVASASRAKRKACLVKTLARAEQAKQSVFTRNTFTTRAYNTIHKVSYHATPLPEIQSSLTSKLIARSIFTSGNPFGIRRPFTTSEPSTSQTQQQTSPFKKPPNHSTSSIMMRCNIHVFKGTLRTSTVRYKMLFYANNDHTGEGTTSRMNSFVTRGVIRVFGSSAVALVSNSMALHVQSRSTSVI